MIYLRTSAVPSVTNALQISVTIIARGVPYLEGTVCAVPPLCIPQTPLQRARQKTQSRKMILPHGVSCSHRIARPGLLHDCGTSADSSAGKVFQSGLPPVTFGGLPVHCPFDYAFELLDVDDDEDEELRALYSCSPRNDTPATKPFAEGVALIPLMEQAAG